MSLSLEKLKPSHRERLARTLLQLRRNLASGVFLKQNLYTVDDSRLAGNTHHYWIRLGLNDDLRSVLDGLVSNELPPNELAWLKTQLKRRVVWRLPREYSSLIKIPFSFGLDQVADERVRRTNLAIGRGLPAVTQYGIFHLEINRLLKLLGDTKHPPVASEISSLLAYHSRNAIAKARKRFPEVWDELRGHYVLDSRGAHFGKKLVEELVDRKLLLAGARFSDIGSGVGTNIIAVNQYSQAHATGIEIHAGLHQMSKIMVRRLTRLGLLEPQRIDFLLGDAMDATVTDLGVYDVIYVYSPIGMLEIDIDSIVDGVKVGAVVIFNRLPIRNIDIVSPLDPVAGLFAFRKISEHAE